MFAFAARRLLHAIAVVFGVSVAVFFLIRLGGDPSALFLPPEASLADIARLRVQMGFDQPVPVQFAQFLGRALHGDFGQSLRYGQPAMALVLERVPATLELAGAALGLAVVTAVPLGLLAAARRGRLVDRLSLLVSLAGQSFPAFWLAIMLILLFSETWRLLPPSGRGGWRHLVLPATALAAYSIAIITRLLRAAMIEALQSDYVRTAKSKGLAPLAVMFGHALRNAAIPVVTVLGLQAGALLGGAVITEQVFAWPGMGRLVIQAIANRDFTVVQAFVMLMAVLIVGINLLVDLSYAVIDPRIRVR